MRVAQFGNTDLFGKEGHDGEEDERHKDTVRPELQLVPILSPGRKQQRTCALLPRPAPAGKLAETNSPNWVTEI